MNRIQPPYMRNQCLILLLMIFGAMSLLPITEHPSPIIQAIVGLFLLICASSIVYLALHNLETEERFWGGSWVAAVLFVGFAIHLLLQVMQGY
jgi:hypothetical protein